MTARTYLHASAIIGLVCVGTSLVRGQQGSIAGPLSGFTFDNSARVLRPIRGIPGASLIGDPIQFGFDLASASVSPSLNSVVVVSAVSAVNAKADMHVFQLNNGTPVERTVDGLAVAQRVVFSPSGTAAALFANGSLQVLKGLPDAPVIAATIPLGTDRTAQFSAAIVSGTGRRTRRLTDEPLAISDDGGYLLVVSGGAIRLIGTAGDNRKLMDAAAGAWAAFAPGNHDAAVLDAAAGLVFFQDVADTAVERVLAGPDSRMPSPVGVAFSPDGQRLFVASAGAQAVAAFDVASGNRNMVACDCTPTGLVQMGGLFRLNEMGSEPLWLLDARTSEPRMIFVPARGTDF
jgi:DNA-binding beta-propeller fold protein YncE